METLFQDLRYAIRMLMKNSGFTTLAVLALALGIGANTAIFSVVNAVLLRPLPYPNPEQLMVVWSTEPKLDLDVFPTSGPDFTDWKSQNRTFQYLAAFNEASFNLTGQDEPERVHGATVSADLFPLLGVQTSLGRTFNVEEEQPGRHKVAVLSHNLWQRRYGSNPNLIGQTLALNGESYAVIGVLPSNFKFPEGDTRIDVWVPINLYANELNRRGHRDLGVIGRLKPGVTMGQAQTEMNTIASRLAQQYQDTNTDWGIKVASLQDQLTEDIRPSLLVLLGAVGFVLLIACANVANLYLARAMTRQKEVAVRMALGASRFRLIRQFLTESVLLAVISGAVALLLAFWGIDGLMAILPADVPRLEQIGVDKYVLGFTLLVSVMTGLLLGIAPALQATKPDLTEALKEGSQTVAGGWRRNRMRSLLVISEVALALMLLIGAGLMFKSFRHLREVKPGFDPTNVLTMRIALPQSKYAEDYHQAAFFQQLLQQVETLPGVQSAGVITNLPLVEDSKTDFTIEGQPDPPYGEEQMASYGSVNPNYFRAMGIPILKGRSFTEQDTKQAAPVAIISETLARRYWPNEDPIGKRFKQGGSDDTDYPWLSVVGVVGDVRHYGLDVASEPEMYLPYQQHPQPSMFLVIRAAPQPMSVVAAVRHEIQVIDREQPVSDIKTMEQLLAESVSERSLSVLLLGIFAAVALILATVGIYGIVSYSVGQRTHEIGVRIALGAQPGDVLRLIVGQGLKLVLVGIAVGLIGAFALTRVMSSLLFGVSATDPATFAGIAALLAGVSLIASYIPARRATKVDPMIALRYE